MARRTFAAPRAGFTLIELLVVISIIAILAGLLLVGLSAARRTGQRTTVVAEINSMDAACSAFRDEFKFSPPIYAATVDSSTTPPTVMYSPFTIPVKVSDPGTNVLRRMFPRWDPLGGTAGPDISPALDNKGKQLEPIECFMYFLNGPTGVGWQQLQPYAPTGNTKKGPFFNANPNRLAGYMYKDAYGTPYAYMPDPFPGSKPSPYPTTITVNGSAIEAFKRGTRFVNAGTVQIVSAGENKAFFAKGNSWDPTAAVPVPAPNDPGGDDLGNFNNGSPISNGN